MAEGATDLNDLLGSGPVQNPTLPQSTTFSPIVTGGTDPFVTNGFQDASPQHKPAATLTSNAHMFSTLRYAIKNLMTYIGVFIGAFVISLSTPRSLILQYIPHTYTSGGVPSYLGAAVLAGVAVAIAYVVGTLGASLV
jgi:hypothetical protein